MQDRSIHHFACPVDKMLLSEDMVCPICKTEYPIIRGIPVLLNEDNSVFRTSDYSDDAVFYQGASGYAGSLDTRQGFRKFYRLMMNRLSEAGTGYKRFGSKDAFTHIQKTNPDSTILIVGAGDTSYVGNVTYTDVAFGKNVDCIADGHDLPFENSSFDAVFVCAVLEHVVDPQRCVAEIWRVLRPDGFVYSETPFLQPVHMRQYDFTRFTYLGHRRLFRMFDDIESGVAAGPGSATAFVLKALLLSFSDNSTVRKLLRFIGLIFAYPLRLFDHLVNDKASAYDSASAFYFFGRRRNIPVSDRDLIGLFRGGK